MQMKHIAMGTSLGVAVVMLIGKLVAYNITGSAAILSDAAESVVHIAATGVAALSLWYAHRDPDNAHPYGHGKIAYFSGGFEGAMILSAAIYIFYSSIRALIEGPELYHLGMGIVITAMLCLLNLVLGLFLVHVGKSRNVLILVANGKHVLTDMWTSAGVVVGVLIVHLTGIVWLDPVCALLVSGNIFYESARLILRAFRGLLDEADAAHGESILKTLRLAVDQKKISGFHQLRHREANDVIWIEVHMLVPGNMTTANAHLVVTEIENAIQALFPQYTVHVTTHIEPDEHEEHHPDGHPALIDPYADKSA